VSGSSHRKGLQSPVLKFTSLNTCSTLLDSSRPEATSTVTLLENLRLAGAALELVM